MTRLGILILGGTALVLLAAVALEETSPFDDGAPEAGIVRAGAAPPPHPAASTPAERADETDAQVAVILGRPLFSRDRRPEDAAVAVAAAAAELPRLTGIVIGPDGRHAFFAPAAGGKAAVVAEGGTLGPYRIVSITAGGVRVEGPGAPRVLTPAFGPPGATPVTEPDPQALPQTFPGQPQMNFQPGFHPPLMTPGRRPVFPGQAFPGQALPGQVVPGQVVPNQLAPGQGGPPDASDPGAQPPPQVDGSVPSQFERTLAATRQANGTNSPPDATP